MSISSLKRSCAASLVRSFHLVRGQDLGKLIRRFSRAQWLGREELREWQLERLRALLDRAAREIPFYREKFRAAGFHPGRFRGFEDLRRIPPTTKDEVRDHFQRESPSAWKRFWSLSSRRTSGSTGDPMLLWKGPRSLAAMDALMFRNYAWFGVSPGDAELRFWGVPFGKRRFHVALKDFLLNRTRVSSFSIGRESCARVLRMLEGVPSCHIYGYARSVFQVAAMLKETGAVVPENRIRCVILTGEMVSGRERQVIESVFRSRTVNEYGCTEVGVIAMECPSGSMHLMENLRVELDAPPGSRAGEVLVTELTDGYFPLIRYRLGDVVRLSEERCPCGRGSALLEGIEGRSDELISCPDGRVVDPYFFEYLIQDLPSRFRSISRFRIVQVDRSAFRFLLVSSRELEERELALISGQVRGVLGRGVNLLFQRVPEIPPDPSGKLRCFVREKSLS